MKYMYTFTKPTVTRIGLFLTLILLAVTTVDANATTMIGTTTTLKLTNFSVKDEDEAIMEMKMEMKKFIYYPCFNGPIFINKMRDSIRSSTATAEKVTDKIPFSMDIFLQLIMKNKKLGKNKFDYEKAVVGYKYKWMLEWMMANTMVAVVAVVLLTLAVHALAAASASAVTVSGGASTSAVIISVNSAVTTTSMSRQKKDLMRRRRLGRRKRVRKRRRDSDLEYKPLYWYGGQKMKLLVMLSYLLDLVRSFDPVPDGVSGGSDDRSTGLQMVVDEWINPDTRSSVELKYGPIADWDTSGVVNMAQLFFNKATFNADISKWDVSNVVGMELSTFSIQDLIFLFFPFHFKFFTIRLSPFLTSPLFAPLSLSLSLSSFLFFFDSAAFASAEAFNSDVSKWDVSKVTNMFASTIPFTFFI